MLMDLARVDHSGQVEMYGEAHGLLHNDVEVRCFGRSIAVDDFGKNFLPKSRGLSIFNPGEKTKLGLMGSELRSTELPETDATPVPDDEQPVVLIVEDNADIIQFIHACVEPFYQVHIVNDGEEGVTKAKELGGGIILGKVSRGH